MDTLEQAQLGAVLAATAIAACSEGGLTDDDSYYGRDTAQAYAARNCKQLSFERPQLVPGGGRSDVPLSVLETEESRNTDIECDTLTPTTMHGKSFMESEGELWTLVEDWGVQAR